MIQLHQVLKEFTRRGETITAFKCDDLVITSGEYIAVVGPSGCGKSTLLSLLGGMLSPTRGEVLFEGQSLYRLTPAERSAIRSQRMGFVFQTFNLIPYLTALQNVQIPLCLTRWAPHKQIERATELLSRFGLADRLGHRPAELSVGQQQRVALARTLANDPQIILADEPTGNLDPDTRNLVLSFFDELHSAGKTVIVVTHDPCVAERATQRLALARGEITAQGSSTILRVA